MSVYLCVRGCVYRVHQCHHPILDVFCSEDPESLRLVIDAMAAIGKVP